ncbi:MAG TPA: phosphoglucosamine mutase [Desulfobacterales bacterium]|nr:phosphoglucosamine mutase [Desulfobacterales bacterium]
MAKLFGTDGIRGVANTHPMTPELALSVGRALARVLRGGTDRPRFVIGQDTRISGNMLAHALVSGIGSSGAQAELLGVLPTPGIAFMTRATGASGGIVISASHNPYQDNGIKIFNAQGCKLPDETEVEIERIVLSEKSSDAASSLHETGRVIGVADAVERYSDFLKACGPGLPKPFASIRVVLDCANGATYQVAPRVFSDFGAAVETINTHPDGKNINANCGSQHPEALCRKVVEQEAHLGLAFDGDGDRLIAVDETGDVLSGDRILAICARQLHKKGRLNHNTVVSTVMSNIGLGEALKALGIRHVQTQVGDRYVMQAMLANGAVLGGEDSGHMIFAAQQTTGDGILSAIKLVEAMVEESAPLSRLKGIMRVFPQVLINVEVGSRPAIESVPEIAAAVREVENGLAGKGRVLVRYSGTQPMCRVMVEGPTKEKTEQFCRQIAAAVAKALG